MLTFIREAFERQFGKITPAKLLVGLAILILAVRVLGFVIGLFDAVLPFVILGVVGYFAYQLLESRAPGWRDKVKNAVDNASTRRDTAAEDAVKKATRNAEAVLKRETPIDSVVKTTVTRAAGAKATEPEVTSADSRLEDAPTVVEEVVETETQPAARLMVEQKTNPDTGLQEPDLDRLMEKEEEMLKAPPQSSADAVRAQLEERRRRLKGGD